MIERETHSSRELQMNLQKLMQTNDSWGLLVLRVVTGVIYMAHGLPKFGIVGERNLESTAASLASMGVPLASLSALLVASAEAIGGVLIIFGFMTRFVSLTQAFAMLVAIFLVHWDNGLAGQGGYQWALLLFACSVCLMLEGAGRYSVDGKLAGKK
jgi:putative oxidoreductase